MMMPMQLQWCWLLVVENSFVMEETNLIERISIMGEDCPLNDNDPFRLDDEFHCNSRLNHRCRAFVPMEY